MFKTIKIGGNDYQLRLDIKNICALESSLKTNPLNVLFSLKNDVVPKITDLQIILHYALQSLNHGITLEKTQELIETYFQEGGTVFTLTTELSEVLQESGIITNNNSKN